MQLSAPACPCAVTMGKPKVEEFVAVKTKTKTVEEKIITTTRVETPAAGVPPGLSPVCPQKKVTTTVTTVETVESCPMKCSQQCEQPKCRKVCTETCVVGKPDVRGGRECKTECVEDCGEPKPAPAPEPSVEEIDYIPAVEEKGGVEVETRRLRRRLKKPEALRTASANTKTALTRTATSFPTAAARLLMTTGSTLTAMRSMPNSALSTGRRTQN